MPVWQVKSICMLRGSRRRKKLMKIHVSINSLKELKVNVKHYVNENSGSTN